MSGNSIKNRFYNINVCVDIFNEISVVICMYICLPPTDSLIYVRILISIKVCYDYFSDAYIAFSY